MSIKNKLISNTIYLFLDWFALSLMGFLYWFVAGKTLLPEEYGIVSTSVNLALILGGMSLLGLHAAAWKLIPEFLAKKEIGKINSLIKFSLKVTLLSNFVILFIIFSTSSLLSEILKIPWVVVLISGVILITYSISYQLGYVLYGFQNMRKLTITDFLGQLLKVILSAILILFGLRYFGPLIGFLLGYVFIIILRLPVLQLKGKTAKINRKRIMLDFALPAFATVIAWMMISHGQYVLLSAIKNPEVTGLFTVAMVLTSVLIILPNILNSALLPITSQICVERDAKKRQRYLIALMFRYVMFISLPIAVLLLLFAKPAILIYSRAEYLPAAKFLYVLVPSSLIYGMSLIFSSNIYAIGKTKVNRNIVIITTVVFLLLAVPLIYLYSGFGSAIAYFFSATFLMLSSLFYLRKFLKMTLPLSDVNKLVVSIIISFGLLWLLKTFIQNLFVSALLAFITLILYLIILIPLKFYREEDIKILDFLVEKSPILKNQIIRLRDYLSKFVNSNIIQ